MSKSLRSILPFTGLREVGLKQVLPMAEDGNGLQEAEVISLRRFAAANKLRFTADIQADAEAANLPIQAEAALRTAERVVTRWTTVYGWLRWVGAAAVVYALIYFRAQWLSSLGTAIMATISFVWNFKWAFLSAAVLTGATYFARQAAQGWGAWREARLKAKAAALSQKATRVADIAKTIRKTA